MRRPNDYQQVNNGARLAALDLDRSNDAIKAYEQMVERFGDRPEPGIAETVATALFNKGVQG